MPESVIELEAILVENGNITQLGEVGEVPPPEGTRVIDANGYTPVPGFIDLQLNGGFGKDFTLEPESIWEVAAKLPRYGVTTFLPPIITSPRDTIGHAQAVFLKGPPTGFSGAIPPGHASGELHGW